MEHSLPEPSTSAAPAHHINPLMRFGAYVISYLFHPVFMTAVMSIALYYLQRAQFAGITEDIGMNWLISIMISTVLFPLLTVFLCKALGFIKSIHLDDSRDRIIPLIGTMTFHFWIWWVFRNNPDTPVLLRTLLLGSFVGVILMFMVSIFYKVSLHTSAAGGMVGLIAILGLTSDENMATPFFIALGIAGLIGTARLVLRAHTQGEIWMGYAIGIIAQVGAWLYLR